MEGGSKVRHYTVYNPDRPELPTIVMLPGQGLSTELYESTPDGRLGWAPLLQARGFDVYVF